ncbi:MAG: choice-of-anchor Q domain-containing protein, partial [Chthoniobacteraceae bacterium]
AHILMRSDNKVPKARRSFCSTIEVLEARIAPATIIVTTLADSGEGSLRAAIDQANASEGADLIKFKASGEILLESALPAITDSLTIKGKGSTKTSIDGADAFRILEIASEDRLKVAISGVTLENGHAVGHGGALAIDSEGSKVSITKSVIRDNSATGETSTTYGVQGGTASGGGISNANAQLIISKSTITGNSVTGGSGISGPQTPEIADGQNAGRGWQGGVAMGGGIYNGLLASLAISKSTISGNNASGGTGGDGGYSDGYPIRIGAAGNGGHAFGGGIYSAGMLIVQTSSISGNTSVGGEGGSGKSLVLEEGAYLQYAYAGRGGNGGNAKGGAIFSAGASLIEGCTISANEATGGLAGERGVLLPGDIGNQAHDGFAGWSEGGALWTEGDTVIVKTVVSENRALNGGGVFSASGALRISGSTLASNVATGDLGGALAVLGPLGIIENSEITDNRASKGGGIYSGGDLQISNTILAGNVATSQGGAIVAGSALDMSKSQVTGNTAGTNPGSPLEFAGGIFATGTTRIVDSLVSANTTTGNAGGIDFRGDVLTIERSIITSNTADGSGGGIASSSFIGDARISESQIIGNTAGQDGGGLHLVRGKMVIDRSTISSNTAQRDGGGLSRMEETSELAIRSSTISGNTASGNGGGIFARAFSESPSGTLIEGSTISGNRAADGAGIYQGLGFLQIINSTLALNEATESGGAISIHDRAEIIASTIAQNSAAESGGGLWIEPALGADIVQVLNTILAGNTAPIGSDMLGAVTARFSLIQNTEGGEIAGDDNLTAVDPLLGALKKNGGATLTMAPKRNSPVVDAGGSYGGVYDQTGDLRLQGAGVDIGAVEAR